ncbi:AraC family transcriptional regulator [Amaricoccus sp. W119]|uniref:AraC family transcriptional regulator n=1 Tax=Amaricoccus sp. W119 TaxID=3391833 RepID=UPI0039A648AB
MNASDPTPAELGLARLLRAQPLPAAPRDRVLRPAQGPFERFLHILLLETGEVLAEFDGLHREVEAPVALTLPSGGGGNLTLVAGSSGWLLGLSPGFLTATLGDSAEAQLLAPLARGMVVAQDIQPLPDSPASALAQRVHDEIAVERPGSGMIVQCCLRLILAEIWRQSSFEPPLQGGGSELQVLQGFRRLVELHFRGHLKVAGYADHLGVTYDRLHRICQRNLRRSPLQLIHQRQMREAATWLTQSGRSIQQIAHALGFGDASEFSHFFKRNSGMAPSVYRTHARNLSQAARRPVTSFADWP